MRDKELGVAKLLTGLALLAIVLSLILINLMFVLVFDLQRGDWSKWFLFGSYVLFLFSIISGLSVMWLKVAPIRSEPAALVAGEEEADGEDVEEGLVIDRTSADTALAMLYAQIASFGLASIALVIYLGFLIVPKVAVPTLR
ncbi:MAG: hypothetical protein ACYC55_07125 [Candidatus Geothermincolia bacterium]